MFKGYAKHNKTIHHSPLSASSSLRLLLVVSSVVSSKLDTFPRDLLSAVIVPCVRAEGNCPS